MPPPVLLNQYLVLSTLKIFARASLVAQWLRIRLPMQGTRVRALVREDPTCCGAAKSMSPSYWACALEPSSHVPRACAPQQEKPPQWEAHAQQRRPSTGKNKLKKKKNFFFFFFLPERWVPNTVLNMASKWLRTMWASISMLCTKVCLFFPLISFFERNKPKEGYSGRNFKILRAYP